MSDLETARAEIVATLEAVLPGRVYPHPPTTGRYVTPSIFVEQTTGGGELDEPLATFPIWIVADGAVQAQIEAHDGLVWNTLLAVYPLATNVVWRPMQVAGLRATVVEAEMLIDSFGLCGAPAPVAYTYNGREAHHANR